MFFLKQDVRKYPRLSHFFMSVVPSLTLFKWRELCRKKWLEFLLNTFLHFTGKREREIFTTSWKWWNPEVKRCPNKESETARGHVESGLDAPESQTYEIPLRREVSSDANMSREGGREGGREAFLMLEQPEILTEIPGIWATFTLKKGLRLSE